MNKDILVTIRLFIQEICQDWQKCAKNQEKQIQGTYNPSLTVCVCVYVDKHTYMNGRNRFWHLGTILWTKICLPVDVSKMCLSVSWRHLGKRRYMSTHSSAWDLMNVSGHLYILAVLAMGKQPQYPNQCWCTWFGEDRYLPRHPRHNLVTVLSMLFQLQTLTQKWVLCHYF